MADDRGDSPEPVSHTRRLGMAAVLAGLVLLVTVAAIPYARSNQRLVDQLLDRWLTMKVEAQYALDADVRGRDILVVTTGRQVTLSGPIAGRPARQQAVAIAQTTDGVERVVDRLWVRGEVEPTGGRSAGDDWIVTSIRAAYFDDSRLKRESIAIRSLEGRVRLAGAVASPEDRERAVSLAHQVEGVQSVDADNLMVIARVPSASQ